MPKPRPTIRAPERPLLPRRERRPTAAELTLWRTVMGLAPAAPVAPSPPTDAAPAAKPAAAPATRVPATAPGPTPALERRLSGRLKRGVVGIEGRLDLHGMTQEDAHRALGHFLGASAAQGRRLVLVITGKGGDRDGRPGILQRSVPRWLAEAPNRAVVGSFGPAHPRDGGGGALYIVLRRKRPLPAAR